MSRAVVSNALRTARSRISWGCLGDRVRLRGTPRAPCLLSGGVLRNPFLPQEPHISGMAGMGRSRCAWTSWPR